MLKNCFPEQISNLWYLEQAILGITTCQSWKNMRNINIHNFKYEDIKILYKYFQIKGGHLVMI